MAKIVLIRHAEEKPLAFDKFMMSTISEGWTETGHEVTIAYGYDDLPDADVAVLHLNRSVVPDEYVQATKRYPLTINGGATDIRKRHVSRNLLNRDDDWGGPVIVKTDLNFGGYPEWQAANLAADRWTARLIRRRPRPYRIIRSINRVPNKPGTIPRSSSSASCRSSTVPIIICGSGSFSVTRAAPSVAEAGSGW